MKKYLLILSLIIFSLELSGQIKMPVQYGQHEQGVAFIENVGQFRTYDGKPDKDVLYKAQVSGGAIYIRNSGISFVLEEAQPVESKSKHDEDRMLSPEIKPEPRHIKLSKSDMNFSGANSGLTITALEPLESYCNYYIGREEFTNVRSFRKIVIRNVYDKIDFAIYSNQKNEPEYDFIVHPGGNPNDIALEFTNHEGISTADMFIA